MLDGSVEGLNSFNFDFTLSSLLPTLFTKTWALISCVMGLFASASNEGARALEDPFAVYEGLGASKFIAL